MVGNWGSGTFLMNLRILKGVGRRLGVPVTFLVFFAASLWAGVGGSIYGTVTDASGAVIAKATVTSTNTATGVQQTVATDVKGSYSFPSLPIGTYDIEIASAGFRPYRHTGIVINANSALVIDAILQLGELSDA